MGGINKNYKKNILIALRIIIIFAKLGRNYPIVSNNPIQIAYER